METDTFMKWSAWGAGLWFIICLGLIGFGIWVIIKILQHFTII